MPRVEAIQGVLSAFAGLFTQPFEQDLNTALKSAAVSISVTSLQGLAFLVNHGGPTALEIGGVSLILVIAWMTMTAILTKAERKQLTIARNISVVSFWIAVTLVFVFSIELVFSDPLDRANRLLSVLCLLLVFVPVHMFLNFRNLGVGLALMMTLALWLSTGALAFRIIY